MVAVQRDLCLFYVVRQACLRGKVRASNSSHDDEKGLLSRAIAMKQGMGHVLLEQNTNLNVNVADEFMPDDDDVDPR